MLFFSFVFKKEITLSEPTLHYVRTALGLLKRQISLVKITVYVVAVVITEFVLRRKTVATVPNFSQRLLGDTGGVYNVIGTSISRRVKIVPVSRICGDRCKIYTYFCGA